MSGKFIGPMSTFMDAAPKEIDMLTESSNHWMCKGRRSIAVAATLLQQDKIVAVPTDTIYGLAGVVCSTNSIERLYEIKNRNENKPLSISVGNVNYIHHWAVVEHIPQKILTSILPGPFTLILKRKPALNPTFNPNHDTVGIRVPNSKFINSVSEIVGPLALTSANVSNEPSCLFASEFKHLWPQLGGIFHDCTIYGKAKDSLRKGSTIVDLTEPFRFKIVRLGVGASGLISLLKDSGYEQSLDKKT